MKSFFTLLVLLISFCGFSQKSATNTFTVSKANLGKITTINDIISNFPTYEKVLKCEISGKVRDKPTIMWSPHLKIEDLKSHIKNVDSKSSVYLDLKLKHHDSKISAINYKIYVTD